MKTLLAGGSEVIHSACSFLLRARLVIASFVILILMPQSAYAITVSTGSPDGNNPFTVFCAAENQFQVFEMPSEQNLGSYSCDPEGVPLGFGDNDISYVFIEVTAGETCNFMALADCRASPYFGGEASITLGTPAPPVSAPTFSINKTTYLPDESISFTCINSEYSIQIYDMSTGIDGVVAQGGNIGNYPCAAGTLSFASQDEHQYSALHVSNDRCNGEDYATCFQNTFSNLLGELAFSVEAVVNPLIGGLVAYRPEVVILSPTRGVVFSHVGLINYSATDQNNTGSTTEEQKKFGLISNPVSLYYSDAIAGWNHEIIRDDLKTLIASELGATGPYTWSIIDLIPGVFYRIIADALDAAGELGQSVSDFFTVDYDAPQFVVTADPPVTRSSDVTITIVSSKELALPPTVTVTQEGGVRAPIEVSGDGLTFTGVYQIINGYDGIAVVSVTGVDRAGNNGTTIISGGTFAVGVEPPPKPSVTTPYDHEIVTTPAITLTGEARTDTFVVLRVNGIKVATTSPDQSKLFTIPHIALAKDANHGVNVLSVSVVDPSGVQSEEVSVTVKFNVEPVATVTTPVDGARVGGDTVITVKANDENKDPLLYTYQVIQRAGFDSTASATSTKNEWVTIAENVPSGRFVWDATEVEDGDYYLRASVYDGIVTAYTDPIHILVRNTLPLFRFEDGRKTIVSKFTATLVGRVLTPESVSPRPTVLKAEYSVDSGKRWIPVKFTSGSNTPEARFSIAVSGLKEGINTTLWRVKDSRGLLGRSSHSIIVDTDPPPPPVVSSNQKNRVTNEHDVDRSKKGLQIDLSGTAEPQSVVTLTGLTDRVSVTTSILGTFLFHGLEVATRGVHEVRLVATDQAGNVSTESIDSFIYDNPPVITFIKPKQFRGLQGAARVQWKITDIDNDPIRDVLLMYRRGNGTWTQIPVDSTKGGVDWDTTRLVEARDYQLRLEASDGIASSSAVVDFAIDSSSPLVQAFQLKKNVIGASDTFEGSGVAEDAGSGIEYVEYALVSEPFTDNTADWVRATITNGFLGTTAKFLVKHPTILVDGVYKILVRATDAAGNVSSIHSDMLTIDTTPPRVGAFSASLGGGVSISPDKNGMLTLYTGSALLFGVSLESDTVRASLAIESNVFPLQQSIATGLWEGPVSITGSSSATLLLTAEDERHNVLQDKNIGMVIPVRRGTITDGTRPVVGAQVTAESIDDQSAVQQGTIEVMSQEDGTYELVLPAGTYRLRMRQSGYRTEETMLTLPQAAFVTASFVTEQISVIRQVWQSIIEYVYDAL